MAEIGFNESTTPPDAVNNIGFMFIDAADGLLKYRQPLNQGGLIFNVVQGLSPAQVFNIIDPHAQDFTNDVPVNSPTPTPVYTWTPTVVGGVYRFVVTFAYEGSNTGDNDDFGVTLNGDLQPQLHSSEPKDIGGDNSDAHSISFRVELTAGAQTFILQYNNEGGGAGVVKWGSFSLTRIAE